MTLYEPVNDTASNRAVMLLIHGGAYLKLLDQNSPDIVLMSYTYFAQIRLCRYFYRLPTRAQFIRITVEEVMVKKQYLAHW